METLTPRPFPLGRGIVVSLGLHLALAAPWLTGWLNPPPPPRPQQLVLDLNGLISTRQIEEQAVRPPQPVQRQKPAPPHPVQEKLVKAPRALPQEDAVPVATEPEKPVEHPATATAGNAEEAHVQQTVQPRESEEDQLRRYLLVLRRAIQAHLAYPPEARLAGQVGATVISFTLADNGNIIPDTLSVHASSGSSLLDANAIKAAQASAPFSPPPRQMNVRISLSFARDL